MKDEDLQDCWTVAKIGEICDLINGRAFKPSEWSQKGLPILRIQNLNNPNASFNYFDGSFDDKHRVNNGDLLFAWSGTPGTSFGAHIWKRENSVLNQHIFKVVFDENSINKSFFCYAINQKLDELILSAHGGVGLRHITKSKFENTNIVLPSWSEQKEIASRLDDLLTRIDRLKTRLDAIPQILKRFRQSVLAAAVSGRLTEVENKDKTKWIFEKISSFCESISDGDHQAPPRSEKGIPFLVISDLSKGFVNFENVTRWVPNEYYESIKEIRKPRKYDILYTVTGSFGISVVVNDDKEFCFQRHIALLKPKHDKVNYKFLQILLSSPEGFQQASTSATGTAQKTVSLKSLRNFIFYFPPIQEQDEIVRRVEQLFAFADQIENRVKDARAKAEHMTPSVLARAFRGELTADWREQHPHLISGENSAKALLEKIRSQKESLKPAKKTRTRSTDRKKD
ncbi:restriction endonuclease subunit S [Desulfobotulus mexicanus]|uniref:Specificity determinant for hsdM and hsdR n=1 Tax=Desulfobotulus mexicanus TaxID=2586642 RepID=A0A5Q4VCR2_9BACT|nr:restriction endonuclease subunit S [Desulfobotulus mexicanus]TYT75494.1 specificity determinant for hsdM and hsdR [Desulfobotulus mexicanus]